MSELEIIGVPQSNFVRTVIDKTLPDVRTYVDLCNRAVAQTGHLVGTDFSYADMNLLPVLAYLRECPESGEVMSATKELAQYFDSSLRAGEFQGDRSAAFFGTAPAKPIDAVMPTLHQAPIKSLRPTQLTIGLIEVEAKRNAPGRVLAQGSAGILGIPSDAGGDRAGQ